MQESVQKVGNFTLFISIYPFTRAFRSQQQKPIYFELWESY